MENPSVPILVAGLIDTETTLRVEGFPIPYFPVRYPFFGVNSSVSTIFSASSQECHSPGSDGLCYNRLAHSRSTGEFPHGDRLDCGR